jgi:hypothetical protein
MSEQEKIKSLQFHIEQLVAELRTIDLKNPKLSAGEYLLEKERLTHLKNLKAIARNELNSLLHQYRFTIAGKILSNKGEICERVVRARVFSDIDCTIDAPATLRNADGNTASLLAKVKTDYANYFVEGKFEVKRVKKIR